MQMTIRMPDEYKEKIEAVADQTGLKKSDIARLAIKSFLKNFEHQADIERPSARGEDLIGVVSSGICDLGTNHRRHLPGLIRRQKT